MLKIEPRIGHVVVTGETETGAPFELRKFNWTEDAVMAILKAGHSCLAYGVVRSPSNPGTFRYSD